MPRLFHTPPKYRLHKSTNQAIVSFNGKKIYLGPYGSEKSHRRYQEVVEQWRSLRHEIRPPSAKKKPQTSQAVLDGITPEVLREKWKHGLKISINQLIVVFIRHAREYYRKNGEVTREAELIEEVLLLLGKKHGRENVNDFGPVDLDNLRDDFISDFDWSRKHLNKQIGRIIRMFKWAAKKEICSASVHVQLKSLGGLRKGRTQARETKGVTFVEDAIVDQTLPRLPEIVAEMVRFQRLTGARPGEVCSVRPGDIDRTGDVWFYKPDAHKTEHYEQDRIVAIGPQAQVVLRPFLLRPKESYCFSPRESVERKIRRQSCERKTPLSCGNTQGSNRVAKPQRVASARYKVASYRLAVRRACNKLGIDVWTPNQLRHTAATEIRKEFGLEAAQVICGHQTADVTQVYAERDLELAAKVARSVG